jgi:hypothetical protein
MLSSAFAETSEGLAAGDRKVYTIIVEEADFITIYWLLKWIYGNWLLFREDDDPREAVDGTGAGWSTKWLHSRGNEWDWKTFNKADVDDTIAIGKDDTSVGSGLSVASGRRDDQSPSGSKGKQAEQLRSFTSATAPNMVTSAPRIPSSKAAMTPVTSRQNSGLRHGTSSSGIPQHTSNQSNPVPISTNYPISPRGSRHTPSTVSTPDPHPHPTAPPPPASALSMYQVAHRYAIPGLASLALEHMMSTITPASSFALLLATSLWEELHTLVEDYVVERWEDIAVTTEFETCCDEVAAGEYVFS